MNRILSGGFSGRLFEKVRTQRGLAYSVFGQYGCNFFYPGIFFVGLSTRTAATAEGVTVVKSVLEGLHQQVGAVELEQAKEQFFSSLVFRYDQAGEILERRMYYAYRDMDEESFQKLIQEIREVTSRDVLRVAREYLRPDGLTVLSVGEEEKLVEQLQTLGDVAVLPQP
jgi:predicted Zn-dependent peptidase